MIGGASEHERKNFTTSKLEETFIEQTCPKCGNGKMICDSYDPFLSKKYIAIKTPKDREFGKDFSFWNGPPNKNVGYAHTCNECGYKTQLSEIYPITLIHRVGDDVKQLFYDGYKK